MPASWSSLDMCIHFSLSYSPCDSFFESPHHRDHMTETFFELSLLALFDDFLWVSPSCLNHLHFLIYHHLRGRNIIKQHEGFMSLMPCWMQETNRSQGILLIHITLYASTMPSKSGGTPTGNNLQEDFHCLPKSLSSSGMSPALNLCFLLNLWPLRDIHTKGPWASFNTWFCSRNDPGNTCFCQTSIESNALRNCCI